MTETVSRGLLVNAHSYYIEKGRTILLMFGAFLNELCN